MRIALLLVVAGLVVACGGGGDNGNVREDVAETIEGFIEAFFNGEFLALSTYLSEECSEEDVEAVNGAALFTSGFIGGEVEVSVDVEQLVIEDLDDDRVLVLADQPEGTFEILVDGRPLPDDEDEGDDDDIELVREEGVWRIANCEDFAADFSDDGDEELGQAEAEPLKEYAVGEAAETGAGNTLTVYSFEFPASFETFSEPEEGNDFALIDVEGCTGAGTAQFSAFDFSIQMADNTRWESTFSGKEPGLNSTELTANDCVRGFVTFEIARGQDPAFVVFDGSSIIKWAIE